MAADSTIRLRQINQPEISGYTVQVIQSYLTGNISLPVTGGLTGSFYPLKTNPSGYIGTGQTGVFKTQTDLDSLYYQLVSYVGNNYYPNSNPSNYGSFSTSPVYVVGDQNIDGLKTFSSIPKVGSAYSIISTGAQTIGGSKTFTNDTYFSSIIRKSVGSFPYFDVNIGTIYGGTANSIQIDLRNSQLWGVDDITNSIKSLDWQNRKLFSYDNAGGFSNTIDWQTNHLYGSWNTYNLNITGAVAISPDAIAFGLYSFALGDFCESRGVASFTHGSDCRATGINSHAEGSNCFSSGAGSHAEGQSTSALGSTSHTEGFSTITSGIGSHAEGYNSKTTGSYSHAEGVNTLSAGLRSHSEGSFTIASGNDSHAEGESTISYGEQSHSEGYLTISSGIQSHAEGYASISSGAQSHAEGSGCRSIGNSSHAEGANSIANGASSHSEGNNNIAYGIASHAEGYDCVSSGNYSHAEGHSCNTYSDQSHAEGYLCSAYGGQSHAEGYQSSTSGSYAHSEGSSTKASGLGSHAEGHFSQTFGMYSHAEGQSTQASGNYSHVEGNSSIAKGDYSHAEGSSTISYSSYSHSEGQSTIASGNYQHAEGKYNIPDSTSLLIIGNGTSANNRSNILTVNSTSLNVYGSGNFASGLFVSGIPILTGSNASFMTTGQTGSFVTTGQTGTFVTTGQTGIFITTGQTGAFVTTGQTGTFITTGQTGNFAPFTQAVLKTGAQTINGVKTFSNDVYFGGSIGIGNTFPYRGVDSASIGSSSENLNIYAGDTLAGAGYGIGLNADFGAGVTKGGSISLNAGLSVAGNGGDINLTAGQSSSSHGGNVNINGGSSPSIGGNIYISPGPGDSDNGYVYIGGSMGFNKIPDFSFDIDASTNINSVGYYTSNILTISANRDTYFKSVNASNTGNFISGLYVSGCAVITGIPVYLTGNQTISGTKTFATRPTVNGTGVLLSGEAATANNIASYSTITSGATGLIVINFSGLPNQQFNLSGTANIGFSGSNWPGVGKISDLSIFIKNTAVGNCNVFFPTGWINVGVGWPTSIVSGKSAVLALRAVDTEIVIGTFNAQL